nr:MAG TPA: ADP-ribosylation factor family protein [Caudoviricetes sp.]
MHHWHNHSRPFYFPPAVFLLSIKMVCRSYKK